METTPLTVVIVHWNQPAACAATVESFRGQELALRFLVVDNDSSPRHHAELQRWAANLDDVTVIERPTNGGFSGGANAGLRVWLDNPTASEWALLCPHDVEVGPDCVRLLLTAAEAEPMAGLACADVGDGHIPVIDPYFGGITMVGSPEPGWQSADYPHGTLMALRRDCVAEVGLFDETYFAYCEEAELALRARAAGWAVGLVRGAMVTNVTVGSSVPLVDYLQQRNTLRLVATMSGRYHVTIRLIISLLQILDGVIRPERAPLVFSPRARWLGIRDFLLRRSGPPPAEMTKRTT